MQLVSGGLSAYVHDFAVGSRAAQPHMISVVAPLIVLHGIRARLSKGRPAQLVENGSGRRVVYSRGIEQTTYTALEGNLSHCTIEHDVNDIIFVEPGGDRLGALYSYLKIEVPLPIHRSWSVWVWETLERERWLKTLETRHLEAYEITAPSTALMDALRWALLRGELPDLGNAP